MTLDDAAHVEVDAWVGRTEERRGCLTPELAGMLAAAVSHDRSVERDVRPGGDLPCLWHWAAFPEFVPHADLGTDGHPKLGGFLPPLRFPRRMWAGGKVCFEGALRIGEALLRRSEILAVTEKEGATGRMAFVKVAHTIEGETSAFIEEEQDIVYLDIPEEFRLPKKVPLPDGLLFDEPVKMDEARLFRFSAATYNAHRIHYDLPYAQEVEKYPGLVVHGPMQAIMLIDAAKRYTGRQPKSFTFRGLHPMFVGDGVRLTGKPGEAGTVDLWTAADAAHVCMQATMEGSA